MTELLVKAHSEPLIRRWFEVTHPLSEVGVWCYSLLIRITIASEINSPNTLAPVSAIVRDLREDMTRLVKELTTDGEPQYLLFLLLIVREHYTYMMGYLLENLNPLANAVATLAFEADGNISASATKTLLLIATVEGKEFIEGCIPKWYDDNTHWRQHILAFFCNLIQVAPVQSYVSFSTMKKLFLRAYDPYNPRRAERNICAMPALRLVGMAVSHLPNVSFQQQMQYLAVGCHDGSVQVINLKTTGVVASFASHLEAILCVAYSSSTLRHDIAVLSEKMDTVKVWHASCSSGVLSTLFTGSAVEFHLGSTIEIPQPTSFKSTKCELQLLVTKCKLKWLSPHCVELCTPFHDRQQLTVP
nr:unnamed protein product [Trypanosoma congolense IL3000]